MMKIKRIPLSLCGVMLGFLALGNLLESCCSEIKICCGLIALLLLILVLMKIIMFPKVVKDDLQSPVMASIFATLPMALMLFSTYLESLMKIEARYLWIFAVIFHVVWMGYFTLKFILRLKLTEVFASYYIVYVGIGVAAISAPVFNEVNIGRLAFKFAFISFLILLVLVTIRYIKEKEILESAKPLICIYAAPANLCLTGYVHSIANKSIIFLLALFVLAMILYVFSLVKALGYLKSKFYPSYAAFTFPFVISAIASKQMMIYLIDENYSLIFLPVIVLIETIIAVFFMIYTFVCFIRYIFFTK